MKLEPIFKDEAYLVVHNLGGIVNVPRLIRDSGRIVVEDNCEGLFGGYAGEKVGTACFASSASFFANKIVTCGEGGVFMTKEKSVYEYAKDVSSQGCLGSEYTTRMKAYNYRITNVQAAILYSQLLEIDKILANKSRVFCQYEELLRKVRGLELQPTAEACQNADWMFCIKTKCGKMMRAHLKDKGVDTRPMFPPINHHDNLSEYPASAGAGLLHRTVVMLPSHPTLTEDQVSYVCSSVIEYLGDNE